MDKRGRTILAPGDNLKREMDEAREFLRSFTLGRPGFTQRDGVAAIERVRDICQRMQEGFASGKREKETVQAVTFAKNQVLAARTRLDLLRSGPVF